jgi:predicted nucleic acid-binding protein
MNLNKNLIKSEKIGDREMPVLDTRFFIEFYGQKNQESMKKLKNFAKHCRFVSVITLHELLKLFTESEGKDIAEQRIHHLRTTYEIIDVSEDVALLAARFRIHKSIPTAASLIGATAMIKDKIVVSDDPHFIEMKDLKIKWI